jgi:hypothetical protein
MCTEVLVRPTLLFFAAALPLLAQSGGIPVRSAPTDYATRNVVDGITVAASVVSPDQVRKLFPKDLNHEGYIVVEVAVFPATGAPLDISPDEFTLRVGNDGTILTSRTPAAIAAGDKKTTASKSTPPQLPGNVHVYNSETIGYESRTNGPYGRQGGVYTGTSTTVGVGNPPYPPSSAPPQQPLPRGAKPDWTALKQELEAKELPAGRTAEPVAGYLYFLRPATKEKRPDSELVWYRTAGQIRLSVPAPK